MTERKTVTVNCGVKNGIVLRFYEMVEGPLGIKTARQVGEPVTVGHGATVVDAEFWKKWSEQNKESVLFETNHLSATENK